MCLKVFELHESDTAARFYGESHEDTTIQLPKGKLYPAVRRVRGPNLYEGLTRYRTYVLSYTWR